MSACKFAFCLSFVFFLHSARAQRRETAEMGKVKLSFLLDEEGTPVYTVLFDNKPVVLPSRMGFVLKEDSVFYRGFAWDDKKSYSWPIPNLEINSNGAIASQQNPGY